MGDYDEGISAPPSVARAVFLSQVFETHKHLAKLSVFHLMEDYNPGPMLHSLRSEVILVGLVETATNNASDSFPIGSLGSCDLTTLLMSGDA